MKRVYGSGNDHIYFGSTGDILTGGLGADTFHFVGPVKPASSYFNTGSGFGGNWASSSPLSPSAVITDFDTTRDRLDLSAIDANSKVGGDQAFKFVGTWGFTKHAGELRYEQVNKAGTAYDKTMVYGDVNGDGKADFSIELSGLKTLDAGDFWF